MAKKPTLQDALEARRSDPRAIRGAVQFIGGKPRITMGVVGEHRRISIEVDGDKLKLVDDPNAKAEKAADAPEKSPAGGKGGQSGTDTTKDADAGAGTGDNATGD